MQSPGYSEHTELPGIGCARKTSTDFKTSKATMTFSHKRNSILYEKIGSIDLTTLPKIIMGLAHFICPYGVTLKIKSKDLIEAY